MSETPTIWVVDGITSRVASIEVNDGSQRPSTLRLATALLPTNIQEGDVFRVTVDRTDGRSVITIVSDAAEQSRRLARSRQQVSEPSPHDPGGDVTL